MTTGFSLQEELAAFGSDAGGLDASGGLDDFWGTVVGFKMVTGEFQDISKDEEGREIKITRITRQLEMAIETDDGVTQYEWFPQPTDRKTGEPRRNKDGTPSRPHKNSKWGILETKLQALGVPTGQVTSLVGLHAHFLRIEVLIGKDKEGKEIKVNGRFVVDWEHYNNKVRQEAGLVPLTNTRVPEVAVGPEPTPMEVAEDPEGLALKAIVGRTTLDYFSYVQDPTHGIGAEYARKDTIERWQRAGFIELDGRTYKAGEHYPYEVVA